MALYAIGDVQGCHAELLALLDRIGFDSSRDQIWLTGDLVNRGPQSLQTLRTLRALGDAVVCVLGNHDLHMLAVAYGVSKPKHSDTFADVLHAADRDELLEWLRQRPLLHRGAGFYLIHAGLPPDWSADQAETLAREAETWLRGEHFVELLGHMYGNKPNRWAEDLGGWDRLRFIINCLTRLRYCSPDGKIDFKQKGSPGSQPAGLLPWFDIPGRRSMGTKIVFGHWSTLGLNISADTYCLDTGCLWGGELTAMRLDDGRFETVSVRNSHGRYQTPSHPKSLRQ